MPMSMTTSGKKSDAVNFRAFNCAICSTVDIVCTKLFYILHLLAFKYLVIFSKDC